MPGDGELRFEARFSSWSCAVGVAFGDDFGASTIENDKCVLRVVRGDYLWTCEMSNLLF
jgi:hypothetical protein